MMGFKGTILNATGLNLKRKMAQESGMVQPYEKIGRLKLMASDGKQRETDCANTKTIFRIIQSISSHKAKSGTWRRVGTNCTYPFTDL